MNDVEVDRNGLEVLERGECLRLLAASSIGRIGISIGALPVVLPINFRLVDDQVVFRTGIGSKLDAASTDSVVAFEVDEFDPLSHTGWSVVVSGTAHEVSDPDAIAVLQSSNIPRWAPAGDDRVVAIGTDRISGRRITHNRPIGREDLRP